MAETRSAGGSFSATSLAPGLSARVVNHGTHTRPLSVAWPSPGMVAEFPAGTPGEQTFQENQAVAARPFMTQSWESHCIASTILYWSQQHGPHLAIEGMSKHLGTTF